MMHYPRKVLFLGLALYSSTIQALEPCKQNELVSVAAMFQSASSCAGEDSVSKQVACICDVAVPTMRLNATNFAECTVADETLSEMVDREIGEIEKHCRDCPTKEVERFEHFEDEINSQTEAICSIYDEGSAKQQQCICHHILPFAKHEIENAAPCIRADQTESWPFKHRMNQMEEACAAVALPPTQKLAESSAPAFAPSLGLLVLLVALLA